MPVNKLVSALALIALGSCGTADPRQHASSAPISPVVPLADSGPEQSTGEVGTGKPTKPDSGSPEPIQSPAVRMADTDYTSPAAVPAGFRPDGVLEEWGGHIAKDTGASSHLVAALTPRELVVAADLDAAMAGGAWLEVRFPFLELPHIGTYGYGGGIIHPFQCEVHPRTRRPIGAAEKAACQRKLASILPEQERLAARYEARFRRTFRIDTNGVRVLDGPNTLRPVPGASIGIVSKQGRLQLEAMIPSLALPATSDAPAGTILLGISGGPESAPPSARAEDLAQIQLPTPVDFAPFGEARALLLRTNRVTTRTVYQPGEGLPVEVFRYRDRWSFDDDPPDLTMTIVARPTLLFTPPAKKLGRVELAYAFEEAMSVIVFVDGVVKDVISTRGTDRNVVERDGRLHVIAGVAWWDEASQRRTGQWEVNVVEADGKYDAVNLPELAPVDWISVRTFHNQDWSEFGLQGRCKLDSGKQGTMTVGWRWDATRRSYVLRSPQRGT